MPVVTSFPSLTSFFFLTSFSMALATSCSDHGATEGLKYVVQGRCIDYKRVNPEAVCNEQRDVNCTQVTEVFLTAFAGQPPCNVTVNRYDAYLAATRHEIPVDKSLFWHGVYGFVHKYSQKGARKVTLEDTLTGNMIDGLTFCSDPGVEGGVGVPETEFCPSFEQTHNCTWNAEASFWSAASRNFASRARGVIAIMLNASAAEAYSNESYLGRWEVPNLASNVVTRADIWLVHVPGDVIRETCASSSIKQLESSLSAKGIPSTCTENPRDVLWFLCWDHKDHPECQALATSGTASHTSGSAVERSFVMIVTVTLMLLLFV
ncbi:ADP-ribosyl cyclase/cyclic ADP-ribose hydrolase-like [Babylonia areolata]|uniref:ADP-ribosyl cyclase/cyclic ADP-ribose hydrolase-like n=1 Tax=Babylonia areolata TaxID=304850 RepID=UPI003FD641F1